MSTLAFSPANDDFRFSREGDVVSAHLARRRTRRGLVTIASCLASVVVAMTLIHGYQVTRPLPDMVTFAFRV